MGHLPTADQQGKLFREELRWLTLRAIAPRDGQAGTVHPCYFEFQLGSSNCMKMRVSVR